MSRGDRGSGNWLLSGVLLAGWLVWANSGYADAKPEALKVVIDADFSRNQASALSIEKGIKAAFLEVNNSVNGVPLLVERADHRANSARSKQNLKKAFADPHTLFVLGGMHSPPLIKNRQFINDHKMLTLVPWAAGGPITRYPSAENWIFRLSVDDTNAGLTIAQHAVQAGKCQTPHLLLEKTPWGESNQRSMTQAVVALTSREPAVTWFNWNVSQASFRIKLRAIKKAQADCLLFVGNSSDGLSMASAMLSLEPSERLPIYSHWGITGGDFQEQLSHDQRQQLRLTFIQTCFSFVSSAPSDLSRKVFENIAAFSPEITTVKDISAPAGLIHSYDLGRLVLQALGTFELSQNMAENRNQLRLALENIQQPVKGLLKTYVRPFSVYSESNQNAHEALNASDYCMAAFGANNEIVLVGE